MFLQKQDLKSYKMEKSENFFDNRIKSFLEKRGIADIRPTDKKLEEMGLTLNKFNRLLHNKTKITLQESEKIAKWLGVDVSEFLKAS